MLILTRRLGEVIVIDTADGPIEVVPLGVHGNQVRLGVNAPKHVAVHRQEIHDKIQREKRNEES